ncbi:hypothetical protein AAFF_G00408760 [Aldrovandia affinis]|uniref:Tudor domain-containing protein n=1 Tax=Aldrovandia affinis TaxID=143900 RepID=A0AAD7SE97_9TELE|nr:hypothetical protein AAFF_G00408760 [Aldrovandia affinis]
MGVEAMSRQRLLLSMGPMRLSALRGTCSGIADDRTSRVARLQHLWVKCKRWRLPLSVMQVMGDMREGSWSSLSLWKKVALALGLPVGVTVGYVLYNHYRNGRAQKERTEESRMTVPLEVYRSIVRQQASFLDLVGQQTGALVKVLAETQDQSTVCFQLQGSAEQLFLAKHALDRLASDNEAISDIMEVPQTAFGRIIGRGGESMKVICRCSGARVNCPRDRPHNLGETGKISITGARHEVQKAREMIMEKVFENEEVRRRIAQASALRQKRRPLEPEAHGGQRPKAVPEQEPAVEEPKSSESGMASQGQVQVNGTPAVPGGHQVAPEELSKLECEDGGDHPLVSPLVVSKFEIPSPDLSFQPDEHLEVYVSAIENPQHFWIQILGVRSLQLDKLTAEMNRFYSDGTQTEQNPQALVVGDIVAAPYRDHGTWNRARVLGVMEDDFVDLYYVDFGDNGELPPESLRQIRSDFLSLPFQAIECSLAGVCPAGEGWTEAALNDFDQMTYCAQWKPLLAKLCSYSHSEISSWPSVQLYDNGHSKALDLGEELIRLGHAVRYQDTGEEGLKGERDDHGSLQKMLDDVTGATSDLSMSCISLSGSTNRCGGWVRRLGAVWLPSDSVSSLETLRADVDHSPTTLFVDSSFSNLDSTPSRLGVNGLPSHTTLSPSPIQWPEVPVHSARGNGAYLRSKTSDVSMPEFQSTSVLSSSDSSSVEAMTSALNSMALSNEVFLPGTTSSSSSSSVEESEAITISSISTQPDTSSSNSAGIRSVWYYLSSEDSSISSASTTLPTSSTCSYLNEFESETPFSSSGDPSLDLSGSERDREEVKSEVCGPTAALVESSDCSSAERRLINHSCTEPEVCPTCEKEADGEQVKRKKHKILDMTEGDHVHEQSMLKVGEAWALQERPDEEGSHGHTQQPGMGTHTPAEANQANGEAEPLQYSKRLNSGHMNHFVLSESRLKKEVASISGSVDDVVEDQSL